MYFVSITDQNAKLTVQNKQQQNEKQLLFTLDKTKEELRERKNELDMWKEDLEKERGNI